MSQCNPCKNFQTVADVRRFTDRPGEYCLSVSLFCKDCRTPFRFVGLPVGEGVDAPAVNAMGIEAKLPIRPGISVIDAIFKMEKPK